MRILLIEDDETLCQTIPFQLHQEGFSVDVATHGEDGLHFARERVHDLILLDRMLPGLDGMDVLRTMRREGIATPVIFLTALGQVGDRTQGLNSGADDYIVKPFVFEELLARILWRFFPQRKTRGMEEGVDSNYEKKPLIPIIFLLPWLVRPCL